MYEQREIVLVPLPFSDLSSAKKRPVMILSNNKYNRTTNDVVVCAITSQLSNKKYSVQLTQQNLEKGILPVTSELRTDKIYTMSQRIIIKKFGKLDDNIFHKVIDRINELLVEEK